MLSGTGATDFYLGFIGSPRAAVQWILHLRDGYSRVNVFTGVPLQSPWGICPEISMASRISKLLNGTDRYTGRSMEDAVLDESSRRYPQFSDDSLWSAQADQQRDNTHVGARTRRHEEDVV